MAKRALMWYRRSGQRVSRKAVERARASYVESKRTGRMGPLPCTIQPRVADRVEAMSLMEFANTFGMYTYRFKETNRG